MPWYDLLDRQRSSQGDRYPCRVCQEHVAVADKPPQSIDKGLPGPGLLAQTITTNYADHLPLYRRVAPISAAQESRVIGRLGVRSRWRPILAGLRYNSGTVALPSRGSMIETATGSQPATGLT
jgi:transposase